MIDVLDMKVVHSEPYNRTLPPAEHPSLRKMFQAAARTGSAFVVMQWHATCVPEGTAQRANRADQAVYQQLKAAQEEERHKQSAARAEAERKKQQSGMRRYLGSGDSGSKA